MNLKPTEQQNRDVTWLNIIAKYEDVRFPIWGYLDKDSKMDLNHRIGSIIKELEFMLSVFRNAQDRLDNNVDLQKFSDATGIYGGQKDKTMSFWIKE